MMGRPQRSLRPFWRGRTPVRPAVSHDERLTFGSPASAVKTPGRKGHRSPTGTTGRSGERSLLTANGAHRALLALSLILVTALPLMAQPLSGAIAGHWRPDSASMAAGGTLAPMPLLGEVRPDSPTSLPLRGRGEIALELGSTIPCTYVQGRRYFVELRVDTREMRASVPLGRSAEDARWWLGWSMTAMSARLYHRDRWLDDRARGGGSGATLALAWREGPWTLGAARHDADLSGVATGDNLARLLDVRRGHERAEFGWDGGVDTVGAQYERGRWMAGAQLAEREDTARLATEVSGNPFTGVFATDARTLDAWLARRSESECYVAYVTRSETDPAPSAIASGAAIRGRTALSADSTVVGIGRRRSGDRATEHLELTWMDHAIDFSGRLSDGVLGSLDGQISAEVSAGARTVAARWGRTRRYGAWSRTLAASAMHTELRCHARAIDSPGPFRPPAWEMEERLDGGEGWVGSVTLGLGREVEGWQVDARYTLLGGDTWGHFRDLREPRAQPRSALPPDPPTGPSPTLDLGWVFSVQVSREL